MKEDFLKGKSLIQIAQENDAVIGQSTLYKLAHDEDWKEEKRLLDELQGPMLEELRKLSDPNLTRDSINSGNHDIAARCLRIALVKMEKMLMSEMPLPLASEMQKLITALEKFNTSHHKEKTGGVDQKQISHVHTHVNLDNAMNLVLESKKKGVKITLEEAMNVMEAQYKKVN